MRDTLPARVALFLALAEKGRDALAALPEDIAAAATAADLFPRMLADGYARASMPDQALHWLTIAVDRGFINHPFLAVYDPFFATLRNLPRFQHLMASVRERWTSFEP